MKHISLSLKTLQHYWRQAIDRMVDQRKSSNNTTYSIEAAIIGGSISFFMQSEPFLEHQHHLKSRSGINNAPNHSLDAQSVAHVSDAGRSRWKTENENHNILKTRGYHLDHNFGHDNLHLSKVLFTLSLLAFLFHTVLKWIDKGDQQVQTMRETRKSFFSDLLSLTNHFIFDDWQHLMDFMLMDTPQRPPHVSNTS